MCRKYCAPADFNLKSLKKNTAIAIEKILFLDYFILTIHTIFLQSRTETDMYIKHILYIKSIYMFRSKMVFPASFGIVVEFVFFVAELSRKRPKTM